MVDCCTNRQRICQEIVFQCIATLKLVEMVLATAQSCYILCLAFIGSKLVLGANEQREVGSFARDELRNGRDALATDDRSLRRNWGDVAFRTPSNSLDIPRHALLRMHRRIQRREREVRSFHNPHKRSASSEASSSAAQSTESNQSQGPASRDQGFHSPLANPIADWNHGVFSSPINDIVASATASSDPVRTGASDASDRSREDMEEAESDLIAIGREATNSAPAAFDRPGETGSRNDSEDESSDLLTGSKVSKTSLLRFLHKMVVDENATGSSVLANMIPSDVLQEILRSGDAAQSTTNRSSRLSHWLTAMTRRHHHTRRGAPSRHKGGVTSLSELLQQQMMTHRNEESQPASPLPAPHRGAGSSRSDLSVSGSLTHQYLSQSSTKNHYIDGIRQFGKQTLNKIIHKRGGTHLRILQNGTVDFVQEEDIYCVVLVKPVEQRGDVIVKIRGERSRQYLAMRQNGSLYGTADASDLSTKFFHVYYPNSHDAYRSVRYGSYVARTNDGRQPKRQVRTSTNRKAKLLVLSVSDSLLGRLRSSEMSSSNTPTTSATTTTLHLPSARSSHVGVSVSPAPVSGHGESEGPPTAPSTKVITTVTSEPAVPATITSEPKPAGTKGTKKGQRGRKCRKRRRNKKCLKSKKTRKCKKRKRACKQRNKRKSKKQKRVSRSVRSEVGAKSRLVRDSVTTHQRRKRNLQWQLGRLVMSTRSAQLRRILFDELRTYLKRRSIDGT